VIRDGSKVKIMKHLWLRSKGDKWIHSPKRQEVYVMNMNQLVVEGEKRWDTNKIQEFLIFFNFNFIDMADAILSVPMFPLVQCDKLI
jgi:hypothetical protein